MPHPLHAVRRRFDVLRRYRELLTIARHEGFGPGRSGAPGELDNQAVRLRRVLEAAGGVYVKLGQIDVTRVDLLPSDVCADAGDFQNRVPAESSDAIAGVLAEELGDDLDAVFAEFDWEPPAAASIGQTHLARLRTGEGRDARPAQLHLSGPGTFDVSGSSVRWRTIAPWSMWPTGRPAAADGWRHRGRPTTLRPCPPTGTASPPSSRALPYASAMLRRATVADPGFVLAHVVLAVADDRERTPDRPLNVE